MSVQQCQCSWKSPTSWRPRRIRQIGSNGAALQIASSIRVVSVARALSRVLITILEPSMIFLVRVMSALDNLVEQNNGHAVVLVAPAKALSTLREVITFLVKSVLKGEITKDLVNEPVEKIGAHLRRNQ